MAPREKESSSKALLQALKDLPVARLEQLLRTLSPKAVVALIESLDHPETIVSRLRNHDFYYLVKEAGHGEAMPLLSAGSVKQLLFCSDIEFWKRDMIYPPNVRKWIEIFSKLELHKIEELLGHIDPELLVSILRPFMKARTRNLDLDYLEELDTLPAFTLDNIFFLAFPEPYLENALKTILESLFMLDSNYYYSLMLFLASGVTTEAEDTALRLRTARLAEQGFPSFEDAQAIYHDQVAASFAFRRESSPFRPDEHEGKQSFISLSYPLQSVHKDSLFMRCLNEVEDPQEQDRISLELAQVANKIMVADGLDPSEPKDLYCSLEKASGYINIALEELSSGSLPAAAPDLREYHMEHLFRRGFQSIQWLRKDAYRFISKYEGGIENLGYPLAMLLRDLMKKRPLFAAQAMGESKSRNFETSGDLRFVRNLLSENYLEGSWENL